MNDRERVIRITTRIAVTVALIVAVLLPFGYYSLSYQYLAGKIEVEAEINSQLITSLINLNPDLWQYEEIRLEGILSRRVESNDKENRRLFDLDGRLVAGSGPALAPPLIMKSRELMAAGLPVGRIEISRSLAPLLLRTGFAALIGLVLGLTVFITLRVVPLRAVAQAEESLRRLNAELEQKVEERTMELVASQEVILRKEKLAILGQLAGTVAHELRNPLGVMNNAVYYLQMTLAGANETTREYLSIIKQEIGKSQQIINELLDFARTRTPQCKVVLVRELITESLKSCPFGEGIELILEIPDDLPPVMIDFLQMQQTLQNLFVNGAQAMPQGGTIRVTAHRDGDFIRMSIGDTGIGISPESMKHLFQPLYTTKPKGVGLGLVVCRNLVEANGGRIEIESNVGQGTIVTVILPVAVEGAV